MYWTGPVEIWALFTPSPGASQHQGYRVKAAWLAGSHDRAGKLAHGLRCAPTTYASISDCIAAVGVSGIAPLTRCRGGDVVPYSDVWHCAATAFAGAATAGAVFADCLSAQRHTAILQPARHETCCIPTVFRNPFRGAPRR